MCFFEAYSFLRRFANTFLGELSAHKKAEGTGLEPATGRPAPDFESGRSPIRIPS